MKLLIIYNPQAGAGRAKKLLPKVAEYLKELGLQSDIKLTEYSGHAVELVRHAELSCYDAIIASGGDGTLFEVINGYFKNPLFNQFQQKLPIGLIPNGTGNAFMKELKLKRNDWKRAIELIGENKQKAIDVGLFTTQKTSYYFLNIVGMGFISEIAEASIAIKWMGNVAYTIATLLKLMNLKSRKTTLTIDGETIERQAVLVEVANSSYTGTSFYIAPKAKVDDGLLDIIILNNISKLKLLRVFKSIYKGEHIHYPEIEYFQAKQIKINDRPSSRLTPDGEILGETPVDFKCLPKAINFLWGNT
jgi:diacylglycerol kinase (ATP)